MFELFGLRRWMLGARIGLEAQPFLTSINMFSSRIELTMGWLGRSWFEAYKVCEPIMTFIDILDYFALSILFALYYILSSTFPSKAELFNKLEWAWLFYIELLFLPPLFSSIWESLLYLWLNIWSGLLVAECRTLFDYWFSIFLFCPIKIVYLGICPLWAESLFSLGMFLESIFMELRRLVLILKCLTSSSL